MHFQTLWGAWLLHQNFAELNFTFLHSDAVLGITDSNAMQIFLTKIGFMQTSPFLEIAFSLYVV